MFYSGTTYFGYTEREVKEVFTALYPRLCAYVNGVTDRRDLADDIIQEIFYKFLEPLDKETIFIDGGYPVDLEKNTLAQLNAAAHNEYEEHDVVYKSFAEVAEKEGFTQIAATFRMIAGIEKTHGERFRYLADLLGEGRLYARQEKNSWVCTNCGYIYEGEEPPQYCPVCRHDQGYFAGQELSPWYLKA